MTADNDPKRCVVGIDIGGANLKYFSSFGKAIAHPFPLWQNPDRLGATLASDLSRFRGVDALAITMTGELADCFADRQTGVRHIVDHAVAAARQVGVDRVVFYAIGVGFLSPAEAAANTDLVASANWHALASQVASEIAGDGLLIDIGSTTTDLIPLCHGKIATAAKTDHERLAEGSLVYVGCRRTPVCSLVTSLDFRGRTIPIMNEVFATMDDAFLVLGWTEPDPTDRISADGQPRTVGCAAARLARMLGLDSGSLCSREQTSIARQVVCAGQVQIRQSLNRFDHNRSLDLGGPR